MSSRSSSKSSYNRESDRPDQGSDSASSDSSSSYDSEECVILQDEDPYKFQKTMQVTSSTAALFRKSEILVDKEYDSAEERLPEEEPFPSFPVKKKDSFTSEEISTSQPKPVGLVEEVQVIKEEGFIEQSIESFSSDSGKVDTRFTEENLQNDKKVEVEVVEVKQEKHSDGENNENKRLKGKKEGNKEPERKIEKVEEFVVEQVKSEKNQKAITNSLTEIVRSQSMQKKAKGELKSEIGCRNCSIF